MGVLFGDEPTFAWPWLWVPKSQRMARAPPRKAVHAVSRCKGCSGSRCEGRSPEPPYGAAGAGSRRVEGAVTFVVLSSLVIRD
jgi:hypothetical protein